MTEIYGYRDGGGNVTRYNNLSDAVARWKAGGLGSVCKLSENGRWRTIESVKMQRMAKEKTALHMLGQLIKEGYSEEGTDMPVESADLFGSTWWPIVRDAVMVRDGRRCRLCGSEGNHVHHIMPRHCGGADNPINLMVVCTGCHKMIHRKRQYEDLINHKQQTRLEAF